MVLAQHARLSQRVRMEVEFPRLGARPADAQFHRQIKQTLPAQPRLKTEMHRLVPGNEHSGDPQSEMSYVARREIKVEQVLASGREVFKQDLELCSRTGEPSPRPVDIGRR